MHESQQSRQFLTNDTGQQQHAELERFYGQMLSPLHEQLQQGDVEVCERVGPQRLGQTTVVLGQTLEYEQAVTSVHSTGHVQQVSTH